MIVQFFTSNDNNRLLVVFALLTALQIPFWNQEEYLDPSIFKWLFIANYTSLAPFYTAIWDNSSPLVGNIYAFTQGIFNSAPLPSQILAVFLVCFQAYTLNNRLNLYGLFEKRSLIPAVLYILFVSLPLERFFISSALLSQTFIILFFTTFLSFHRKQLTASALFSAGIYLALAILCHPFWALLLFFLPFLIYIFSSWSAIVYVCFGVALPIGILWLFYAFYGVSDLFISQYFVYNLIPKSLTSSSFSWSKAILFMIICTSFLTVFINGRYTFLRQAAQKVVLIWYVFVVLICCFYSEIALDFFTLTAAPQAVIFTYFVYYISKKTLRNMYVLILLVGTLALSYRPFFTQQITHENVPLQVNTSEKQLLWLGDFSRDLYRTNQLYPPFVQWEIAKPIFENLNIENTVQIYKYFALQTPKVIIDSEGVIPQFFKRVPALRSRYQFRPPNQYTLVRPISLPKQRLAK